MTTETKKPAEIAEGKLDEISGGPHFRTWDSTYYDFSATGSSNEITDGTSNTVMKVRHDTAKG